MGSVSVAAFELQLRLRDFPPTSAREATFRGPHLASFAKLGFAERGTDVDEGTGGEGARVPQFFDRK